MPTEPEQDMPLKFRPRPQTMVELSIPSDALASLDEIAEQRDMSRDALLRSSIGNGLRQDLAQRFGDKVLETTAKVLEQHPATHDAADEIIREIRRAVRPSFVK